MAALSLVLLFLTGSHDADAARGTTDLHVTSPGGSATGTKLPLDSYVAAAAALANDDVKLEWPGAEGLGDTVIDNASITFNAPSQSIVLQGTASVDGSSFAAMLILDWDAPDPMPVISLGLKGAWDMADLNPAWSLDGGAFAIDGFVALATGEQDLSVIPAAASFYGDREELGPKVQVAGSMSLTGLFPGIGAEAGVEVEVSASLDPDIEALLGTEPLEPIDAGDVHFSGSIAASNLSIAPVPGLQATSFSIELDLTGGDEPGTEEEFKAVARGEVTIDDDTVSSEPVTFDVEFTRDGTDTKLDGGLKAGTTWTAPFGFAGVEVGDLRLTIDSTPGETPSLVIAGSASIDDVGVTAEITANDEIAVDMTISPMTVKQVLSFLENFGFAPGSLSSINDEIGAVVIGPTAIHFETEEGDLHAAVSTAFSFRDKTATLLLGGSTATDGGMLAAVQLAGFRLSDIWPGAPSAAGNTSLPDGGIVISSRDMQKSDFEAGGIQDDYLSEMFCGASVDPADCDYEVQSGVSLAATVTLDPGIRQVLQQLGPLANTPVRITGNLPVFGGSNAMSLTLDLPRIVPNPGSATAEWLRSANLSIEMKVAAGDLSVKLKGALNTALPDEKAPNKVDLVTFQADAELRLGVSGVGATLRATVGTWPTPFGVDWVDLNAFVLELDVQLAPQPGVQVGLFASARLQSPCAAFGGSNCPPPSTFKVSFAIGVKAGAPVQVDFGMRIFADAIYLRDVAAIAKRMGATSIDPTSLPNASLRNVEFAFSTIDAPALCLERGLTVAANVYLDSRKNSSGPGEVKDADLCSNSSISPAEGIASCQRDEDCFAHLRLKVSRRGIEGAASLGTIDLAPVTVRNASLTLVLTPSAQEFTVAGDIKIEGFASAKGSVSITKRGFAFSLMVSDDKPTGNLFTIEGSAGLNAGDDGVFFRLKIFARLPGLNSAIDGVQDVIDELKKAFTGEPLQTRYALRCIEANVDLRTGADDPISGKVDVKVHFSAIHVPTRFEEGRVWTIEWNFDRSLAANVAGLATSLSGAGTVDDEVGCGYAPTALLFNTGGESGVATDASATFGLPVDVTVAWRATDFSRYVVTLDLDDGQPERVMDARRFRPGDRIEFSARATYRQSDDGFEKRMVIAEVHLGDRDGPVVSSLSLPMLIGSSDVTDYSVTGLKTVDEGDTIRLNATWTDPVPTRGAERMTSKYTWQITGKTVTRGESVERFAPGPIRNYPNGSKRSHAFSLPIPDPCACSIIITHEVLYNAVIWRASTTFEVPLQFDKPTITTVTIGGSTASPVVASASSTATIDFTDPRTVAGGYQVLVNGTPLTTTTLSARRLSVPLNAYHVDGLTRPLVFEVRAVGDPGWVKSAPVTRDVVFRPLASDSDTPDLIFLAPGVKRSFTAQSTTLFPLATDDAITPFASTVNTGACGAVWFRYTAVATGKIQLRTDGSSVITPRPGGGTAQEIALAVFDDSAPGDPLIASAGPDGNRNVTVNPRILTFDVTVGKSYLIAAAASDMPTNCTEDLQRSGPVVLTVTPLGVAPVMDTQVWSFDDVPGADGLVKAEFILDPFNPTEDTELDDALSDSLDFHATSAPGFDACFDDPLEQTVWYIVPAGTGGGLPVDVTTAEVRGDVQMAVFLVQTSGGNVVSSTLVDCSEDADVPILDLDVPAPPLVRFTPLPAGSGLDSYHVVMFDTHGRQSAEISPILTTASTTYIEPYQLQLGAPAETFDNSLATDITAVTDLSCSPKNLTRPLWFTWTAPTGAPVDIGSALPGIDLALAVFRVSDDAPDADSAIGCSDEPGSRPEVVRLNPTAGETYLIMASSESGDVGTFDLDVTLRADKAVNELQGEGFPVRVGLDTRGATSEGRSTTCPEVPNEGASLWYAIRVPEEMDVDVDTIGSDFDTRLVVSNIAEEIGCSDDIDFPSNVQSRVRADDIMAGGSVFSDLYIRIDGFNGAEGDVRLNVTTRGDDVANAVALTSGLPASGSASTAYATVEADEQRGACAYQGDPLGGTVWFRWIATSDRNVTATATGFDTQVTVFHANGSVPGEIVGCGEDDIGLEASARFAARAGETYFVQVDGYSGATGLAQVTLADDGPFDTDSDTVGDDVDNCVLTANTSQADADGDGIGDACDVVPTLRPVPTARLVDSRSNGTTVDGKFQKQGPIAANTSRKITIKGRGGVPTGAKAVVVEIQSTGATAAGRVAAYAGPATATACGTAPAVASVDVVSGKAASNEVIVPLGTRGEICLFADVATNVIVDVKGFARSDSDYRGLRAARLVDTRSTGTTVDGQFQKAGQRAAGSTYQVDVAGRGGVAANASVAMLDVTARGASAAGTVTVYDCGTRPDLASVVVAANSIRSNEVVVPLSPSGDVCLYTSVRTHLVVDVVGHLPVTDGYQVLTPRRLADTRALGTTVDGLYAAGGQVPRRQVFEVQVTGRGDVPLGSTAAMLDIRVVAGAAGSLRITACDGASSPLGVAYSAGEDRVEEVFARLSPEGRVCIAPEGATHLVIDVVGATPG